MAIFDFITVIGIDGKKLLAALNNTDFADIEDCLQYVCAADYNLDYIVTRNVKDFACSAVPPVIPAELMMKLNKT